MHGARVTMRPDLEIAGQPASHHVYAARDICLEEPQLGAREKVVRDPRHIRDTHVLGDGGERADQSAAHDGSVQPPTPAPLAAETQIS